jgi:phosphomannomutase
VSDTLSCFKAYDIRGRIPDELDAALAYRVGRAFVEFLDAKRVVVGHDIRLSSRELTDALAEGLMDAGADVLDIGLCGTEEIYFATYDLGVDGGIVVTASHNPSDHNGMKLVREGARPISADTGLRAIHDLVVADSFTPGGRRGSRAEVTDSKVRYVEHLLGYVGVTGLSPIKIVVNAGNGGAGLVIDRLEDALPFEFVKIHHRPDGTFPNGIPNPLLPERRQVTTDAVLDSGAAMGVAWDGDFDRCFFFDEAGNFIEGYYLVGLLAEELLKQHPGEKVIFDPRLTWNTIDVVRAAGGTPVQCKSGHAFIKERMRSENALYGGEMSAHHYFRDFAYCDSGMIPWLLVAQQLCRTGRRLSDLVAARVAAYPCSGEINFRVADTGRTVERVLAAYEPRALDVDRTDGIGLEFEDWRFNLRASNTEPLLRLNVESRGDRPLMQAQTEALSRLIEADA